MNDLISREALQKELAKGMIITDDIYGMGIMAGVRHAQDVVKKLPAVDSVEVVQCKDCAHTETDGTREPAIYCKKWDRWEMPEDFFCGYGKRKNAEKDN